MTERKTETESEQYCTCRAPHGTHSCLTCGLDLGAHALLDDGLVTTADEKQVTVRGNLVMRKLVRTIDRRTNQFLRDVNELERLGLVPIEFSTLVAESARKLALALKRQVAEWGPGLLGDPFGALHAAEMARDVLGTQREWVAEPLRAARELKRLGVQSVAPVVRANNQSGRDPF